MVGTTATFSICWRRSNGLPEPLVIRWKFAAWSEHGAPERVGYL